MVLPYAMLLAIVLNLACATRTLNAPPTPSAPSAPGHSGQEGLASFYASSLAGKETASGERYDPYALTAAHRTLPFGSMVRVERLGPNGRATDQFVEVRINDRGPFVRGRIIDLSGAAAERIGLKQAGVARVRVRVIGPR